jgi:hypothetical protein
MNAKVAERLTWFILGLGVAVTAAAYALHGRAAGQSAAAGAGVALGNWALLRFILTRVVSGNMRSKAAFSGLLVVKMGALLGVVFVLLHNRWVEPLPFTLGVSSLVVGSLLGSFAHVLTSKDSAPPGGGASGTAESKS